MANANLDDQDEVLELEDDGNGENDPKPTTEDDGNQPTAEEKKPEAVTEEAEQDDGDRKNGSRMVPITRFNEVNERMKELAAQNQQLLDAITRGTPTQTQQEAPPKQEPQPADLKELRLKHYDALTSGRDEEALELQGQIDSAIEERAMQRAMAKMTETQNQREQAVQIQTFKDVVQQIERDYPQLDVNSDDANEDAILYVVAKRDALIKSGESMADALKKASDAAAKVFGFGDGQQPTHIAKTTTENRKQEALLRNAKAAQAQPPQLGGLGNRATAPQRVDVSTLSEAEFEALPESEKSRLRGD